MNLEKKIKIKDGLYNVKHNSKHVENLNTSITLEETEKELSMPSNPHLKKRR